MTLAEAKSARWWPAQEYRLDARVPMTLRVGVVGPVPAGLGELLAAIRRTLEPLSRRPVALDLFGCTSPIIHVIAAVPEGDEAGLRAAVGSELLTLACPGEGACASDRLHVGVARPDWACALTVIDHADLLLTESMPAPALPRVQEIELPVFRPDQTVEITAALESILLPPLGEAALQRLRAYTKPADLRPSSDPPDFVGNGPIVHRPMMGWYADIYFWLRNRLVPRALVKAQARIAPAGAATPLPDAALSSSAAHRLYAAHLRADQLAIHFSNLHRATVIMVILLGALALVLAMIGLAYGPGNSSLGLAVACIELVVLLIILGMVGAERWWRWHKRWLDYRLLAELLRPLPYLAAIGRNALPLFVRHKADEAQAAQKAGAAHETASEPEKRRRGDRLMWLGNLFKSRDSEGAVAWVFAHLAAVVRHAGIVPACHDAAYLEACRKAVLDNIVDDQRRYHESTAIRAGRIEGMLAGASILLFALTLLVLAVKITIKLVWHESYVPLTLLTAVFPALAAAAFAIRAQLELEILNRRSLTMKLRLEPLSAELIAMGESVDAARLIGALEKTAAHMVHDVADWAEILEPKEAEAG